MRKLMMLLGWGLLTSSVHAAAQSPLPSQSPSPSQTPSQSPSPSASASPRSVVVPAGGGQAELAAALVEGTVRYRVCDAMASCAASSSDPAVLVPSGVRATDVTLSEVAIGLDRRVLHARTEGWSALVAAAPGTREARVLWQGVTGLVRGESGELHGDDVQVVAGQDGEPSSVLLGELREDVTICGRRSLLAPRVLDPRDLAFKSVTIQRLTRAEREGAVPLTARAAVAPVTTARLLQATAASSGIGAPGALTDGRLDTFWAENRGADGRGEFVQLRTPEQVPLTGLSIVVRPEHKDLPRGVAPRRIWIATPDRLFDVTFPDDAWRRPGASFDLAFPTPLTTSCVAVVLEEAYGKGRDSEVTLAEIGAHTALDGQADAPALAQALGGDGPRADTAAAILARRGDEAYDAVVAAYPRLDESGRRRARAVMDAAPCARSAPFFVSALVTGKPDEARHASDRLVRCERAAAPALQQGVGNGPDEGRLRAAQILALTAPEVAIAATVPWLASAKPSLRAELRAVLTKASESNAARPELVKHLADPALPAVAAIDLLRAATARGAPLPPEGAAALARLTRREADFRTRFLVLAPAAAAARTGDARAAHFVVETLEKDPNPHVRARAAQVVAQWPEAWDALVRALAQTEPRVREATLASLAQLATLPHARRSWPSTLSATLASIMESDPFTFVRLRATDALGVAPRPAPEAERALGNALRDASPAVRARAAEHLGARGAHEAASAIRERVKDEEEVPAVRASAARALGALCDHRSVDALTEVARFAAGRPEAAGFLLAGVAAVEALGKLHPTDLAQRLAPYLAKGAPTPLQQAAQRAAAAPDRCPRLPP